MDVERKAAYLRFWNKIRDLPTSLAHRIIFSYDETISLTSPDPPLPNIALPLRLRRRPLPLR